MNGKKKSPCILEHDIFTGEPIDINEMVVKLSKRLSESTGTSDAKKKMSYSISPMAQVLIKKVAEETGVTQGSIVETAPLLFAKMATDSLERRSKALGTLATLNDQISRSLYSFAKIAPHLKPYTDQVETMMKQIMAMEKEAVTNKNFKGVDTTNHPSLSGLKVGKGELPPYNEEIKNFLGKDELFAPFI